MNVKIVAHLEPTDPTVVECMNQYEDQYILVRDILKQILGIRVGRVKYDGGGEQGNCPRGFVSVCKEYGYVGGKVYDMQTGQQIEAAWVFMPGGVELIAQRKAQLTPAKHLQARVGFLWANAQGYAGAEIIPETELDPAIEAAPTPFTLGPTAGMMAVSAI